MTRVFLSYAGSSSHEIAKGLKAFFHQLWGSKVEGMVIPNDPGDELWSTIQRNVRRADLGMFCITKSNVRAEWLYTEFGMLHERLGEGSLVPILYGLRPEQVRYPLKDLTAIVIDGNPRAAATQIVERIALEGPADPKPKAVMQAWQCHVVPRLNDNAGRSSPLSVGWNESTNLLRLIDACQQTNRSNNEFRKYICFKVLEQAVDALATLQSRQIRHSIHQFVRHSTGEIHSAVAVRALCGGKDWDPNRVAAYYNANYHVAQQQAADAPEPAVIRVFLGPEPNKNFAPRKWEAIQEHHERRQAGLSIDPRILPHSKRWVLNAMPGVIRDLIDRGFGFAVIIQPNGNKSVYTHLGRERAKTTRERFRWARYDDPLLVAVIESIFGDLKANSQTFAPGRWHRRAPL